MSRSPAYRRPSRWLLVVSLALIGLLVSFGSVHAITTLENRNVAANEVVDDTLFVSGDRVTVAGRVTGDLFVFANTMDFTGRVDGNLFFFGNQGRVAGSVGGNVFGAGQTVRMSGDTPGSAYVAGAAFFVAPDTAIGRDILFAGYALEMQPGATVMGNVVSAGYQAVVSGDVSRDVSVASAAFVLDGTVAGDVRAEVGAPDAGYTSFYSPPGAPATLSPGLRIRPDAEIGGTLVYISPEPQDDAIAIEPGGGIEFERQVVETGRDDWDQADGAWGAVWVILRWILARARDFVTLLIVGALLLWLVRLLFEETVDHARLELLPSLGWGLVVWIGGFVAIGIAAFVIIIIGLLLGIITLGGLATLIFGGGFAALALITVLFLFVISYVSKVVVAYMVGQWIITELGNGREPHPAWPLLLGVFLYVLVRAIPFLGWLIGLFVTLVGLGAIFLAIRQGYYYWGGGTPRRVPPAE